MENYIRIYTKCGLLIKKENLIQREFKCIYINLLIYIERDLILLNIFQKYFFIF